ncbi:MAG TPA: hypothetical protein VGW12_20775 [Pyrinomonadaceae bacterium]|nr:hypothetical protein [Pyrinomonadaceae bacterium]
MDDEAVLRFLQKLFFWSYGRSTWQYDVLCVLILAFIFLTPGNWFENSERGHRESHQKGTTTATRVLLVWPEDSPANPGIEEVTRRVQTVTNRADVRVKGMRPVADAGGKTIAYEVDIE